MIVVDTNVLSEEMKPLPDPSVHTWLLGQNAGDLLTTAICEAEVLLGVAILPEGRRRRELEAAARGIFALFAGRILPFDSAAAAAYAEIVAERRRMGRPIDDFDAQIAAITRSRGQALATRNSSDFDGTGLLVINPWRPE